MLGRKKSSCCCTIDPDEKPNDRTGCSQNVSGSNCC
jgi:hypothetical protein